jgi:hypothetical protein
LGYNMVLELAQLSLGLWLRIAHDDKVKSVVCG